MYKLTDVSLNKKTVEDYFLAWKKYDVVLLGDVFDFHADYIIRNKNVTLRGFDQIKEYWLKNEKRQNNLQLNWKTILIDTKNAQVDFRASFFGVDENAFVQVQGKINFCFNRDSKISELSERYKKTILSNRGNNRQIKYSRTS